MLAIGSALSAQGTLCDIDTSEVNALLTRAQGIVAAGDLEEALTVIGQADAALEALEASCTLVSIEVDTSLLTQTAEIAQENGGGTFSLSYPEGWVTANITQGAGGGGLLLGSDEASAQAMSAAQPILEAGQAGMLIVFGSPTALSNNVIRGETTTLPDVARYFTLALGSTYIMQGEPEYIIINDKPAAVINFVGEGFEGVLLIVEVAPGTDYAAVAAAAPTGELAAVLPTIQAVAASIEKAET
jgi:hypothetical protein